MFGPRGAHLLVARKFTARRGRFRGLDGGAFVNRQRDRRFVIAPGQPQHGAGDVILLVRRQIAHGPECIIEKLCHGHSVARPDREKHTATTKTPVTALGGLCMLTVRSAPHESVFGGTGDAA